MDNYQLQELLDDNKEQIPDNLYLEVSNILMNRNKTDKAKKDEKTDYTLHELKTQLNTLNIKSRLLKRRIRHRGRELRRELRRNEGLIGIFLRDSCMAMLGVFCCGVLYVGSKYCSWL